MSSEKPTPLPEIPDTPESREERMDSPGEQPEQNAEQKSKLKECWQQYVTEENEASVVANQDLNDIEYRPTSAGESIGYLPFLEALLIEVEDKDEWTWDSTKEDYKERVILQRSAIAVRKNLTTLSDALAAAPDKNSREYKHLLRAYLERSKRLVDITANIDTLKENIQVRNAKLSVEQIRETMGHMSVEQAINWTEEMMVKIDMNNWQSAGIKETYLHVAQAVKQGLLLKLQQEKRESVTDPKKAALYREHCMHVAKIFTDRGCSIDSDICDADFAVSLCKEAMDFEELALRYAEKLERENPVKRDVATLKQSLSAQIAQLPQLQTLLNKEAKDMTDLSMQYTILRRIETGDKITQQQLSEELNGKVNGFIEVAHAEFDSFLNGGWSGAAGVEAIQKATGMTLTQKQIDAWELLDDIGGYGYGLSDKSWGYVAAGAKIGAMITAGITIGYLTGGLGVVAGALAGGAGMTAVGAAMEQRGFDTISEGLTSYGKDMAVNTATMGAARYLAAGRAAYSLSKAGSSSDEMLNLFRIAGKSKGLAKLSEIDEAATLGTRLLGATAEGTADTLLGTTLDTVITGGSFKDNLINNAMFFGLGYVEFPMSALSHGTTTKLAGLMESMNVERSKLFTQCKQLNVDPRALIKAENPSALLGGLDEEVRQQVTEAVQKMQDLRGEFSEALKSAEQEARVAPQEQEYSEGSATKEQELDAAFGELGEDLPRDIDQHDATRAETPPPIDPETARRTQQQQETLTVLEHDASFQAASKKTERPSGKKRIVKQKTPESPRPPATKPAPSAQESPRKGWQPIKEVQKDSVKARSVELKGGRRIERGQQFAVTNSRGVTETWQVESITVRKSKKTGKAHADVIARSLDGKKTRSFTQSELKHMQPVAESTPMIKIGKKLLAVGSTIDITLRGETSKWKVKRIEFDVDGNRSVVVTNGKGKKITLGEKEIANISRKAQAKPRRTASEPTRKRRPGSPWGQQKEYGFSSPKGAPSEKPKKYRWVFFDKPNSVLRYMKAHGDTMKPAERWDIAERFLKAQGLLRPNETLDSIRRNNPQKDIREILNRIHEYGKGNLEKGYSRADKIGKGRMGAKEGINRDILKALMDAGILGKSKPSVDINAPTGAGAKQGAESSGAPTRKVKEGEPHTEAEIKKQKLDTLIARLNKAGLLATIGEPIGRGGFGEVLALDVQRLPAQREARGNIATDIDVTRGLIVKLTENSDHELQILGKLGREPDAAFRDMDGVAVMYRHAGEDFAMIAQRNNGQLRSALWQQMAEGAAQELVEIHDRGVTHADIKPANLLYTEEGVRVVDYGNARHAEVPNVEIPEGSFVMTPRFASPEQLWGRPITPATDIFSLGVTYYNLLTGVFPFRGRTPENIRTSMRRQFENNSEWLRRKITKNIGDPDVHPLGKLLFAMLQQNPEQRPSATQVKQQLAEIKTRGTDTNIPVRQSEPTMETANSHTGDTPQSMQPLADDTPTVAVNRNPREQSPSEAHAVAAFQENIRGKNIAHEAFADLQFAHDRPSRKQAVARLKNWLKKNDVDDKTRVEIAGILLGRSLKKPEADALLAAHKAGKGSIDALEHGDIMAKGRKALEGLNKEDARLLMDVGLAGKSKTPEAARKAAEQAFKNHDLLSQFADRTYPEVRNDLAQMDYFDLFAQKDAYERRTAQLEAEYQRKHGNENAPYSTDAETVDYFKKFIEDPSLNGRSGGEKNGGMVLNYGNLPDDNNNPFNVIYINPHVEQIPHVVRKLDGMLANENAQIKIYTDSIGPEVDDPTIRSANKICVYFDGKDPEGMSRFLRNLQSESGNLLPRMKPEKYANLLYKFRIPLAPGISFVERNDVYSWDTRILDLIDRSVTDPKARTFRDWKDAEKMLEARGGWDKVTELLPSKKKLRMQNMIGLRNEESPSVTSHPSLQSTHPSTAPAPKQKPAPAPPPPPPTPKPRNVAPQKPVRSFSEGQTVIVKRTGGELEFGWMVDSKKGTVYTLTKKIEGQEQKTFCPAEALQTLQKAGWEIESSKPDAYLLSKDDMTRVATSAELTDWNRGPPPPPKPLRP